MVVVTGSTGRVGGLVARRLHQLQEPMRLVVRDLDRAPRIGGMEVEVADYGNPEALSKVLRKGDRVFMVSLWIGGDTRLDLHRSFAPEAPVGQFPSRGPSASKRSQSVARFQRGRQARRSPQFAARRSMS